MAGRASEQGAHIQRQQAAIAEQRHEQQQGWMTQHEKGKSWLEEERQKWRGRCNGAGSPHSATAGCYGPTTSDYATAATWMTQHEKGKSWLKGRAEVAGHCIGTGGPHPATAGGYRPTKTTQQQQGWMTELEKGKSWLEEERQKWRDVASEQGAHIQRQQAAIEQQQATIQGLKNI